MNGFSCVFRAFRESLAARPVGEAKTILDFLLREYRPQFEYCRFPSSGPPMRVLMGQCRSYGFLLFRFKFNFTFSCAHFSAESNCILGRDKSSGLIIIFASKTINWALYRWLRLTFSIISVNRVQFCSWEETLIVARSAPFLYPVAVLNASISLGVWL